MKSLYKRDELRLKTSLNVRQDFIKSAIGFRIPYPRIRKRLRLRPVLRADVVVDLVVIPLRVDRRIDVAEIDGLVFNLVAQHVKIVSVIQAILHHVKSKQGLSFLLHTFNTLLSRLKRLWVLFDTNKIKSL